MIEEYISDKLKAEEPEILPEERMPNVWDGGYDWVKEIEYEKILARVDRFKEKTGLSDDEVEAILDGGNYKSTLETPLDDDFFKEMKAEYGLDRDELLDEALRVAILVITNDKTIEQIETMERETGFTPQQLAKMLEGSAEYSSEVLDVMRGKHNFRNLKEVQSKSGLSLDEITDELKGIGSNTSNNGRDGLGEEVNNLFARLVDVEQEEAEVQSASPEKPKSFRERLKAEKPSTRNPGD